MRYELGCVAKHALAKIRKSRKITYKSIINLSILLVMIPDQVYNSFLVCESHLQHPFHDSTIYDSNTASIRGPILSIYYQKRHVLLSQIWHFQPQYKCLYSCFHGQGTPFSSYLEYISSQTHFIAPRYLFLGSQTCPNFNILHV